MIASVVQGGLDAFQQMDEASQGRHHRLTIETIVQQYRDGGSVGVVT